MNNYLKEKKKEIWKHLVYLLSFAAIVMCTLGGSFFLWRFYGRFGVLKALSSFEFYFVGSLGFIPFVMMVWSHHLAGTKDPGYVTSSHKWLKESE